MGRHKKDCTCDKCNGKSKGCGCRKKGKKCISLNPCTECMKQNKLEKEKSKPKKNGVEGIKERKGKKLKEIKKVKGKRGRPKKVYVEKLEENPFPIITKVLKMLGFCPSCKLSITNSDLDIKNENKYICPKCNKMGKVKELNEKLDIERPRTKKEYLQSVNSVYTWHDYSGSSKLETVAKPEHLSDEIEVDEDMGIKSDEDEIIIEKTKNDKD